MQVQHLKNRCLRTTTVEKVYDLHIDFDAEGKVIGTNIQQIP